MDILGESGQPFEKKCVTNPYLPGWEYVPDGEPHVFGGRVYVFGSHDQADGTAFCQRDYVAWSAPVTDLTNWRCDGVIYRKEQDPHNEKVMKELWAPDVCQGADGRYYLYYCCAFVPEIGIAVCDEPAGQYQFYGYVQDEHGTVWHNDLPFDPGILYEDAEHIWLYSGFGADPISMPEDTTLESLRKLSYFKDIPEEKMIEICAQMQLLRYPSEGCSCLRLVADMKTVISVSPIAPAKQNAAGTSFSEHPFFEASSIRKINGIYYFIYSSFQGHELCYATSSFPNKDFVFRGVIVSNADLGYQENTKARAYYGNNHGGLVNIRGQWYIFYHRHTNNTMFSRQGCAEPVRILEDGSIPQVGMTSCGLNNGPLPAQNCYSAHICCNLIGPQGACRIDQQKGMPETTPYITEEKEQGGKNEYIHNLQSDAVCGVKYIQFDGESKVSLRLRGSGIFQILLDNENQTPIGSVSINSHEWTNCSAALPQIDGVHAVYFKAVGSGTTIDFSEFQFCCS